MHLFYHRFIYPHDFPIILAVFSAMIFYSLALIVGSQNKKSQIAEYAVTIAFVSGAIQTLVSFLLAGFVAKVRFTCIINGRHVT